MTPSHTLGQALGAFATFMTVIAFFGVLIFCLTYHVLAPWRETEMGRNLMIWPASEVVLLGAALLAKLPIGGIAYMAISLLGACALVTFAGVGWWRWVILLRAQALGRHDHVCQCVHSSGDR